jgi:ribosome-binding factor A
MPNIVFAKDETITNAEKINKIINKMYNKKNG